MRLLLILFVNLLVFSMTEAEELSSFQLNSQIGDEARLFFVSQDEWIVRFSARLKGEDLKNLSASSLAPISSVEIAIDSKGKILKFGVFRFASAEIYDVRKDAERLKLVKLEGASALFSGSMSAYRSSQIKATEIIEFMQNSEGAEADNQKILKVMRLPIGPQEIAAVKPETSANREEFLKLLDEDVKDTQPKALETDTLVGDSSAD